MFTRHFMPEPIPRDTVMIGLKMFGKRYGHRVTKFLYDAADCRSAECNYCKVVLIMSESPMSSSVKPYRITKSGAMVADYESQCYDYNVCSRLDVMK